MWQVVVVGAIVVAAAVYAVWRLVRTLKGRGGCGCGCMDCPYSKDCKH